MEHRIGPGPLTVRTSVPPTDCDPLASLSEGGGGGIVGGSIPNVELAETKAKMRAISRL